MQNTKQADDVHLKMRSVFDSKQSEQNTCKEASLTPSSGLSGATLTTAALVKVSSSGTFPHAFSAP